jgi:hypothetical protein
MTSSRGRNAEHEIDNFVFGELELRIREDEQRLVCGRAIYGEYLQ